MFADPINDNILIVSEQQDAKVQLFRAIEDDGIKTHTAHSVADALSTIREADPLVIVCDHDALNFDATALVREIRQTYPLHHNSILSFTSETSSDTALTLLSAGADEVIDAEISAAELTIRVKNSIERIRMIRHLQQQTRLDPLTGLYNRNMFLELMDKEWSRSERYERPLSLIMVDIDRFKQINDQCGHLVGDQVLIDVATILRNQCRKSESVCRLGGDEFCMLLPETMLAGASNCAERCRTTLQQQTVSENLHNRLLTASFGIAQKDRSMTSARELIQAADGALLRSKSIGRNAVSVAASSSPGDHSGFE